MNVAIRIWAVLYVLALFVSTFKGRLFSVIRATPCEFVLLLLFVANGLKHSHYFARIWSAFQRRLTPAPAEVPEQGPYRTAGRASETEPPAARKMDFSMRLLHAITWLYWVSTGGVVIRSWLYPIKPKKSLPFPLPHIRTRITNAKKHPYLFEVDIEAGRRRAYEEGFRDGVKSRLLPEHREDVARALDTEGARTLYAQGYRDGLRTESTASLDETLREYLKDVEGVKP